MTAAELARHQASLGARVARAVREHAPALRRLVRAAEAHGRNVLSGATRSLPEGRPTIARVNRHPSYRAGVADLQGLSGAILAAVEAERVAAYRDSYAFWSETLPESVRAGRTAEGTTVALLERARTAVVPAHGRTLRQEVALGLARLAPGFRAAVVRAGNKAVPAREGLDALAAWAATAERTAVAVLARSLSDAVTLSDRLAGRDCLRAELLYEDPSLPEAV